MLKGLADGQHWIDVRNDHKEEKNDKNNGGDCDDDAWSDDITVLKWIIFYNV